MSTPTHRNWIAVASAAHARRGRDNPAGGFMQVGHGKLAPLKRIKAGDRVAYYAPTTVLGGADRLQSFEVNDHDFRLIAAAMKADREGLNL